MRGWLKVRTVIKQLNRRAKHTRREQPVLAEVFRSYARLARSRRLGLYIIPGDAKQHDMLTRFRRATWGNWGVK